jgi:hypothetical protein
MLNLSGISLLSCQRKNEFFGNSLRFSCRDEYVLQGYILDLQNTSGVKNILVQISGMSMSSEDYQPLTVNNTYLGYALIKNVSYDKGIDVRLATYTINATIFNSGNLFNLNTGDSLYSGVNLTNSNYPAYLIENFNEDFTCDVADNGDYTEQQSIRIKMASGAAIGQNFNPIVMAKQLSANLLYSQPNIGFINQNYSGYKNKPGKRFYSESQNLITNEYSVSETFKLLKGFSGTYSIDYTNALQVGEDGISTVKESARIQGLIPDIYGNYYTSALSGAQYEVNNFSYLRCNDLYNSYSYSPHILNTRKLTYGQSINKYGDTVNYDVSYSNDPKINDNYTWEYTQEIEREPEQCTYKISENGNILGYSTDCNPINKYGNALAAYNVIKTGVYNRIYNVYTGFSNFTNQLGLIDTSENKNTINGTISYSKTYTDNLLYSYSGLRKMTINLDDDFSVPSKNNFNIPNYKEISQPAVIQTLAKRNVRLSMLGLRNTTLTGVSGYLNLATNTINSYIPTINAIDPYISNLSYSWQPLQNSFNLDCAWTYYSNIDLNQFIIT